MAAGQDRRPSGLKLKPASMHHHRCTAAGISCHACEELPTAHAPANQPLPAPLPDCRSCTATRSARPAPTRAPTRTSSPSPSLSSHSSPSSAPPRAWQSRATPAREMGWLQWSQAAAVWSTQRAAAESHTTTADRPPLPSCPANHPSPPPHPCLPAASTFGWM